MQKDYIWNPDTRACEIHKYLKKVLLVFNP